MMENKSEWAAYDLDYITSCSIDKIAEKIRSQNLEVVLYGAGLLGRYALAALKLRGLQASGVCDSDPLKQGKQFCGYDIIAPAELAKKRDGICVFICSTYLGPMLSTLRTEGVENVFTCIPLFEGIDYSALEVNKSGLPEVKDFLKQDSGSAGIGRDINLYKLELMQFVNKHRSEGIRLPIIDVIITEACTLKCKDCSNLMQYYSRITRVDFDLLFESVEKIMRSVDWVSELRVMGGEPLINKNMYKVIALLDSYPNTDKIIVYTNATLIPDAENLAALKNEKILVNITNYGVHSRNHDQLVEILEREGVAYATKVPKFTDSGRILPAQNRTEAELKDIFFNCCTNDVLTLLHGRLYHCPFSANATNLGAIPCNEDDFIDISKETAGPELRRKIEDFYKKKEFLTGCDYCNGRDYRTPIIEAAVQTPKPLTFTPCR